MLNGSRRRSSSALLSSYRIQAFVLGTVISTLVVLVSPTDPIAVPLRQGVAVEPWLMIVALPAAFLSVPMLPPGRSLTVVTPRPPWVAPVAALGVAHVIALLASLAGAALVDRDALVSVRNYLVCATVAHLVAAVAGAPVAWLGPMALMAATWVYGKTDQLTVRSWAVMIQPADAVEVAGFLAILGVSLGLWLVRQTRAT